MDPGRPKNQSYQNETKPVPFCQAHHVDSSHIIFSANGHCMQNLLCYDRFPRHVKN
jgi:hypothetical protein